MPEITWTVRDLRRRWKPIKEALPPDNPTAIRFHRACSWLARAEAFDAAEDADQVLIHQWIAFNALYGQWCENPPEPLPDRQSYKAFIDRILRLDKTGYLSTCLTEHRPLVLTILEDEYLANYFWKAPSPETRKSVRATKQRAQSWYFDRNWTLTLDHVLDRVYLLRCQLMHGAATCGSQLNRTSLRHVTCLLGHLMRAMLLVMIDHGADEDWGLLCYPPLEPGNITRSNTVPFSRISRRPK